jgi:arylformamidase
MRARAAGASDQAGAPKVFLDYDQSQLDRAYDQRSWAPNWQEVLRHFRTQSDAVRTQLAAIRDVPYGEGTDERLDVFPAAVRGGPVHVHVHGGAWRLLHKEDVSFAAEPFTRAGMHYVAPDFSPLPRERIPTVVEQLARALAWVWRNAHTFGGDPARIYLSGHSSGAHLCSVLLTLDWNRYGLPQDLVKGALCLSGIYDLTPVLLSVRREYVELSHDEAFRLSAVHHCRAIHCPVTVACAEGDSPEFIRQASQFHEALRSAGRTAKWVQVQGCNHYEVIGRFPGLALPLTSGEQHG